MSTLRVATIETENELTDLTLKTGNTSGPSITIYAGNGEVAFDSTTVTVETAGSERMRIDSSGNVGIGTSSPAQILHVKGSGAAARIDNSDAGANVYGDILSETGGLFTLRSRGGASTHGSIDFRTWNGTDDLSRMRITSSGNVGIGTSSPTQKLHVDGGILLGTSNQISFFNTDYFVRASTGLEIQAFDFTRFLTGGANERMRIDSSGNVGIGTSSPAAQLHVLNAGGNSTSILGQFGTGTRAEVTAASNEVVIKAYNGTNDVMTFYTGASERMRINSSGDVGIGISPSFALDVYRSSTTTSIVVARNDTSTTAMYATSSASFAGTTTNTPFGFITNNAERMRIDSSGGVGIGTTNPSGALDVSSGKAFFRASQNVGSMLTSTAGLGGIECISNGSSDAAFMTFHRPGAFAGYFGIDTDNYFAVGGWSYGAGLGNFKCATLSKSSGSFKIDHPLKPDTHYLVHSFVEGPQADNIYRGKVALVDGAASVNIDEAARMTEGTFVALNGNVQCFTSNEDGWTAVRGKVNGNILTVEAQDVACTDTVSWLVIGERRDQHMIDANWTDEQGRVITEPEKEIAQ